MIQAESMIDFIELLWSEIIDIEPIVIPGVGLCLLHLVIKLLIGYLRKARESDIVAAFDNGLTLTEDGEVARNTVP